MIPDYLTFKGTRYLPEASEPLPERPDLWELMVGQEYTPPDPAVVILKDDPHAVFDKHWQFFVRGINPGMELNAVINLFGSGTAFFNAGKGFPPRHNWLTGEDDDQDDPQTDKVRSCLHNVVTGVYQSPNVYIQTFDSRQPPPLKPNEPGKPPRAYPNTLEEINLDDYLITPQTHPWMFVVCSIINTKGDVVPFPHGAIYPWTGDNLPRTFFPLIFNHGYGNVWRKETLMRRLAAEEPIPSPYRMT